MAVVGVLLAGCGGGAGAAAEGAGRITVGGDEYRFEPTSCVAAEGSFSASGIGSAPDGTVAFFDVHASNVDDLDGDGQPDDSAGVTVRVGTDLADGDVPDDQPDLEAVMMKAGVMEVSEFEYELTSDTLSGTGTITDYNAVISAGRTAPLSFEVTCKS